MCISSYLNHFLKKLCFCWTKLFLLFFVAKKGDWRATNPLKNQCKMLSWSNIEMLRTTSTKHNSLRIRKSNMFSWERTRRIDNEVEIIFRHIGKKKLKRNNISTITYYYYNRLIYKTGFNFIIFTFNIPEKLSIKRCDK